MNGTIWQFFLVFLLSAGVVFPQGKQVAITIDDLPINGPDIPIAQLRTMTRKLVAAFQKHKVPVVGFVNESRLYSGDETDERIDVLRDWIKGGVELGNHTYSHMGFKAAKLADYEGNFLAGEIIMRSLGQKPRYFRHPFLQMGDTFEIEKAFEDFIGARGYKIAPVTVSSEDWMFKAAWGAARKKGDSKMMEQVAEDYLKFTESNFEASEKKSDGLFGRQIKQILLLHANELNAEGNLDRLLTMLEKRGYTFITLSDALSDPAYKWPAKYSANSDWLGLWAFSEGKNFSVPTPPEYIQKAYADAERR